MTLDRGTLAKIDMRIFAELDGSKGVQLVKVPVSDALWSTWRRYCDAVGFTMGQGVAGLIDHELRSVISRDTDYGTVFSAELERVLAARADDLDTRERRLNDSERSLRASEQRLRSMTQQMWIEQSPLALGSKIGRNERCPCGSGLKYKHCHGLAGRRK